MSSVQDFFRGSRPLFADGLEQYADQHTSPGPADLDRLIGDTMQHRAAIMLSDRGVGRLLKCLAHVLQPQLAVNVGTFTGHSALCLAEGMGADGRVVTCEISADQAKVAQTYISASPHGHKIDLRVAPALETLRGLSEPIGLAFIDGDKGDYWDCYETVLDRLAPRGVILVDNTLMMGGVLLSEDEAARVHPVFQRVRREVMEFNRRLQADDRTEHCLLTISDGVTLIVKRG